MAEGIGYRLALPPPRHDELADFRVLVIDAHPLFPTAISVAGALGELAGELGKAGCRSCATSPRCPIWRERPGSTWSC